MVLGARATGGARGMLADGPMSRLQILAIGLAMTLNAVDGFDFLAMTFAAPGIARDWGIDATRLGIALSAGPVGMTLGSLLLAPMGDRRGRRPLVMTCLSLMTAGMFLTATAAGLTSLCAWRIVTGIGIGGMLAAINAVAAEFSNERRRDLSVAVMAIGYPLGGLIGGFAVADVVMIQGWRSVFVIGGGVTAACLVLVMVWMPESLDYLARQGTAGARRRMTTILSRMGRPPAARETAPSAAPIAGGKLTDLLGARFRRRTLLLVAATFLHLMTFYFFSGWLPKLVSDLGYSTADAIRTSSMLSLGGLAGGLALGVAAHRLGLVRLLVLAMIGTAGSMAMFGIVAGLPAIQATAFLVGVGVNGGIIGLYALLARAYPAELRVTGTGLAIGVARGGAVIGPLIGGVLISRGVGIPVVIAIVGSAALVAALVIFVLSRLEAITAPPLAAPEASK